MYPRQNGTLLERFFSGITEQTFQGRLGVADPALIDYVGDLLVRFLKSDLVFGIRDADGKRLKDVAALMLEAQLRTGDARRAVYRHIGDFALFWAGVYPEALGRLQGRDSRDHLLDYCTQGKRSYLIASSIPSDDRENAVLERLSHDFELCVYGLGEVRREWERRNPDEAVPWCFD
jgi:hypothetical protein